MIDGIDVIMTVKDTIPTRLSDMTRMMSLPFKSSVFTDMLQFFVNILVGVFKMGKNDVIVGLDPETAMRLMEAFFTNPDSELRSAILPPALFHTQEHLNKAMFHDVAIFTTLLCEVLRMWGYRPNAYKSLQAKLVSKLLLFDQATQGWDILAGIMTEVADLMENVAPEDDMVVEEDEEAEDTAHHEGDIPPFSIFMAVGNYMQSYQAIANARNQIPCPPPDKTEEEKAAERQKKARSKDLKSTPQGAKQLKAEQKITRLAKAAAKNADKATRASEKMKGWWRKGFGVM